LSETEAPTPTLSLPAPYTFEVEAAKSSSLLFATS
jgi:hypothetical protein